MVVTPLSLFVSKKNWQGEISVTSNQTPLSYPGLDTVFSTVFHFVKHPRKKAPM